MTTATFQPWEFLRTHETRSIEDLLTHTGFEQVEAYRYNLASIRVRVIDSRFEGMDDENRFAIVEAILEQLPERTQGDIITLLILAPSELTDIARFKNPIPENAEFESPSSSEL